VGKAREQEVRLTTFGLFALMAVVALLTVTAALAFGGRWHVTVPGTSPGQDVGGASATYVRH
jgi:hypothetical protein